jgi:hypothetical protein
MKAISKILFICFNFWLIQHTLAQNPIANINRRLSREGDKLFIEFDLIRSSSSVKSYSVALQLKLDGAAIESPKGLSGHIGQVSPGNGKRITWDMDTDLGRVSGDIQIDLMVTEIKDPCIPINTTPVYASIGSGVLGGGGLLALGLGQLNKYKEPYNYYEDHQNPEDTNFYGPGKPYASRDAAYDEANKHYRNGLLFIGTGGLLIGSGVVMAVQLIKIKRYNKSCEEGNNTDRKDTSFRLNPTLLNGNIRQPGIYFSYRF